jgi:hypothetical protein
MRTSHVIPLARHGDHAGCVKSAEPDALSQAAGQIDRQWFQGDGLSATGGRIRGPALLLGVSRRGPCRAWFGEGGAKLQ